MKKKEITVPWDEGLHTRPASLLVRTASKFGSSIELRHKGKIANARSIISIILLCATMGATIEVEAVGEDEEMAIQAVEQVFSKSE
jgi:phosphocarrier protein HPr